METCLYKVQSSFLFFKKNYIIGEKIPENCLSGVPMERNDVLYIYLFTYSSQIKNRFLLSLGSQHRQRYTSVNLLYLCASKQNQCRDGIMVSISFRHKGFRIKLTVDVVLIKSPNEIFTSKDPKLGPKDLVL